MSRTLSEAESKALLASHGLRFAAEALAPDVDAAVEHAEDLGYPVVLKLCGTNIAHKTERSLVRLSIGSAPEVSEAAAELLAAAVPADGVQGVLVAPMVTGERELIAGATTDEQFGPSVMIGVGGVLAEAVADVSVRLAPITELDATEMIEDLGSRAILGEFRGEPAVDRDALTRVLMALSDAICSPATTIDPGSAVRMVSADINPLIVCDGVPVPVDALVELEDCPAVPGDPGAIDIATASGSDEGVGHRHDLLDEEHFAALFEPRGVVVAGASTHPGKFGFVSLHNILSGGYRGDVYATNRDGSTVLGVECLRSLEELPEGAVDLIFVCTPKNVVPELLTVAASKGIRAAFLTTAGYGESGDAGRSDERRLAELAARLDILLVGPNGQGLVSTPASLCAQIVAPYPPAGGIAVASQSGNLVSSFLNWSCATGVGVSRAVSAGNAVATSVPDLLESFRGDDATSVALAYLEGIVDGASVAATFARVAAEKPLVVLKGGATAGGARAAASHTGSLATDDRTFDGMCAQSGATRAATAEEAFEAAATFATQPLPAGNRVVVMTTAGGWGVIAADAITRHPDLELAVLPGDLREEIDRLLPPRWSRNNPVDLAGGETRDTIPTVLGLIAAHDDVDAVIHLGLGIQSNQARMMREGGFYGREGDDLHGIQRIVAYHERQDARFAAAAAEHSEATGKPILTATELAVAFPENPGPAAVRAAGRLCYPSADRAVTALGHLVRRARFLQRRSLR